MTVDDAPTCGKGLAEHARLPAMLGELTEAVGDVLEHHITALDLTDERSRREGEVYRRLAGQHRRAAADLLALAAAMEGSRSLPMGRHDASAMARPSARDVFERVVRLEEELLSLLQHRIVGERSMLRQMNKASG